MTTAVIVAPNMQCRTHRGISFSGFLIVALDMMLFRFLSVKSYIAMICACVKIEAQKSPHAKGMRAFRFSYKKLMENYFLLP